jgi:hypothetical protein
MWRQKVAESATLWLTGGGNCVKWWADQKEIIMPELIKGSPEAIENELGSIRNIICMFNSQIKELKSEVKELQQQGEVK